MPINLRAHEFAISPGLARPQLVATHFYMRVQGEGAEAPLFIQEGRVYAGAGEAYEVDDLPDWFWTEVQKCSAAALLAVGWQGPVRDPNEVMARRR